MNKGKGVRSVLVNLSNIHSGGALQVAVSFINEVRDLELDPMLTVKYLVSSEVAENLPVSTVLDVDQYTIYNTYGLRAFWSYLNIIQFKYDLVFTLFGPKYTCLRAKKEIVGFAQLWILEFDNPITRLMSPFQRLKLKIKFGLQSFFFRRADHLVVELDHVKRSLVQKGLFLPDNVSVVRNAISNLYLDSSLWRKVDVSRESDIQIGFVTRDYPHKNIAILAHVGKILREQFSLDVRFVFTLSTSEWERYSDLFGDSGATVGCLSVYQCPCFYQEMDAIIFPSLLECFSATPLEALAMKKPLFASDRGFVRDVCQSHAHYFDPLDANDIAGVIAEYFQGTKKCEEDLDAARDHVLGFSNARQRALDYFTVVQKNLG